MIDEHHEAYFGVLGDIAVAILLGLLLACLVAGIPERGSEDQRPSRTVNDTWTASVRVDTGLHAGSEPGAPPRELSVQHPEWWPGRPSRVPRWRPR